MDDIKVKQEERNTNTPDDKVRQLLLLLKNCNQKINQKIFLSETNQRDNAKSQP